MKDKERDTLDELFRSKLTGFEVETKPEDWEVIANRLPAQKSVPLYRSLQSYAAAVVVILLMLTGGLYIYQKNPVDERIVQEIETQTPYLTRPEPPVVPEKMAEQQRFLTETRKMLPTAKANEYRRELQTEVEKPETPTDLILQEEEVKTELPEAISLPEMANQTLIADALPIQKERKQKKQQKWGFGMGGGSVTVGSSDVVPQYVTSGSGLKSESLQLLNAAPLFVASESPKTDIDHKTPVSFGLSVSRYLNDRFSLQTGVIYTYLSSSWTTNGVYYGKEKQKLHFIGVPLSLSYRIAEWNRFNWYAAAGAMTEVNVAGRLKSQVFSPDGEVVNMKENRRMKEWQWSVNGRTGISYPVIRFVSAFAEVGAAYYFDNGSDIETIRTEKPFHVNFQFGLRLGF